MFFTSAHIILQSQTHFFGFPLLGQFLLNFLVFFGRKDDKGGLETFGGVRGLFILGRRRRGHGFGRRDCGNGTIAKSVSGETCCMLATSKTVSGVPVGQQTIIVT
jgi:hypothetical protein